MGSLRADAGMLNAPHRYMKDQFPSLDATQLEHVIGGFAQVIGPIVNAVAQGLAEKGDQKGAEEAQKWGGIAQQVAGSLTGLIGSGGATA